MIALLPLAAVVAAAPVTIDGTVYVDQNGNGAVDAGEPTVAGVKIWLDTADVAISDASGRYTFTLAGDGIVWARAQEGFEPAPAFQAVHVAGGSRTVDLGLRPSAATGNVTFVHASDSHLGNAVPAADVVRAFDAAAAVQPRPHFLVVTGDITNGSDEPSFQKVKDVMQGLDVPFVPVIGNHDVYDSGTAYERVFGPKQYCFDQGGVRFLVLDFSLVFDPASLDLLVGFTDRCLADLGARKVAAFIHAPLSNEATATLADHGVDYLFTGHWHCNRIIEHGGLEEVNTQALAMGGIDFTPAGYRIVSFDGDRLGYRQHTIVDQTVLSVMWPPARGCVAPGKLEVIVAAEAGATMGPVTVAVDGGAPVTLAEAGGWDRTAELTIADGQHTLVASGPGGATAARAFCASSAPTAAPTIGEWTQLQGQASHAGAVPQRIEPPLEELWARPVGGLLRGGSVVVAGGRVFVPVTDLGDGSAGGVVALDARTGDLLWERRVGASVPNAPAVAGDLVVFGAADGILRAVRAADGTEDAWSVDFRPGLQTTVSWLYAAPTVADGVIYVGVAQRFAALEAATGRELWSVNPAPNSFWIPSYAAAGVGGGLVVVDVSRGSDGIVAYDALDGREVWRLANGFGIGVNAGLIVDGDQVFAGNANVEEFAIDVAGPTSNAPMWGTLLHDDVDNFAYGLFGTPALAGDRLVVPTMLGSVVALDRSSGTELWRFDGRPPVIRPTHLAGAAQPAFAGSPVVTGDLVWVGGADGRLSALELDGGDEKYGLDLGAPILGGVVPAGDLLLVGTFDGTVHALWHPAGVTCPGAPGCVTPPGGCAMAGSEGGAATSWSDALWVFAALAFFRRR